MTVLDQQATLDRARHGDAEAVGTLLESYRPYVYVLARGLYAKALQPRLDVADLVQDAMLEAHRAFSSFQGSNVADWVAWLRAVVLHTAGHSVRAHLGTDRRDPAREAPGADPDRLADG